MLRPMRRLFFNTYEYTALKGDVCRLVSSSVFRFKPIHTVRYPQMQNHVYQSCRYIQLCLRSFLDLVILLLLIFFSLSVLFLLLPVLLLLLPPPPPPSSSFISAPIPSLSRLLLHLDFSNSLPVRPPPSLLDPFAAYCSYSILICYSMTTAVVK